MRAPDAMTPPESRQSAVPGAFDALSVLDALGDAIGVVGPDWTLRYLNDSWERILAVARADALGSDLWTTYSDLVAEPGQPGLDVVVIPRREIFDAPYSGLESDFRGALGRGFLAGKIRSRDDLPADDWRRNDPRWSEENFAANLGLVEVVERVAMRHDVSAARVALAWLLAQGDDIVPIPGTKRRATLEDSLGAVDLVLTETDLAELDAARAVSGARYDEAGMRRVRL